MFPRVSLFSRVKLNWFSRSSLLMALAIAVLPNSVFLLLSPWYIVARPVAALTYLLAGVVALFAPRWIGWGVFLLAGAWDLTIIIMYAFHLPIDVALNSIKYMSTIDIGASVLYLVIMALMTTTTVMAAWLVTRHRQKFRAASPVPAVLVVALVTWNDWTSMSPYFNQPHPPFDSAMMQTDLTGDLILEGQKNLLIVMVEGLGAFAKPEMHALFANTLQANLPAGRYQMKSGVSSYVGSTTGATSRELCGKWGSFLTYLGNGKQDCLPRRLSENGYETVAYHGRSHIMFERDKWYPAIGFERLNFFDQLVKQSGSRLTGRCGSVFVGLCDVQVADIVRDDLLKPGPEPKMVYWLTLNSHIPYSPSVNGTLNCGTPRANISNKTVCELSELWLEVFNQVNKIAAASSLPPTDILVVGDHHTPLWQREAKDLFLPQKVDWFLLRDQRKARTDPLN